MTNVGMDIFARLLQMPLLFVANQSSTKLNCCFKVLGVTISLNSGRVKLGCDSTHNGGNVTDRTLPRACERLYTKSDKIFTTGGL